VKEKLACDDIKSGFDCFIIYTPINRAKVRFMRSHPRVMGDKILILSNLEPMAVNVKFRVLFSSTT